MVTKEAAYQKISELVERFDEQYDSYKRSGYNETLTRRDFIDPFFKALGWDIDNELGYAESYREVIHEDKVKVGKAMKTPDYSFRLSGGKRLFFVEAKKPSVLVKTEIQPAYQIRRYGWNAGLPISIITDFEELAIYDCTKKPKPTDKATVARLKYITFKEYLTEFDFIWNTFSKERVLKGSFDKYIKEASTKKGTITVDKDFLISLDSWRTLLAENIAKNNPHLGEDELNFAVQQFLDRVIFLRIAEDRGVEEENNMQKRLGKESCYANLYSIFQEADDKYNSGLFDLRKDKISKDVFLEDKVIKNIFEELYYPSPYEFSYMPVEIMGSAYEQFLGKTITIDKNHRAKIELKPEVRKAGGVYYTPQYVVDYIVQNTVGKLCEGKTPKEVSKLKIVDPACGSGSFLLGAYQYLLDWHRDYYKPKFEEFSIVAGSEKYTDKQRKQAIRSRNELPLTPTGALTTRLKKEILINNIYGVDIDTNAVEVTKLSLLLKVMEGETQATIQSLDYKERVLPSLENNIKSGNSLVGPDIYENELEFIEERIVKPFDWHKAFPEVFKERTEEGFVFTPDPGMNEMQEPMEAYKKRTKGGFDAVIGNPPYVRSQHLDEMIKKHLSKRYANSSSYQPDLFAFFIDKGIELLSHSGLLGYIIPNGILTNSYYAKSRFNILSKTKVRVIVDLKDKVFEGASVDTSIFILQKENSLLKRNENRVNIGEFPAKLGGKIQTPINSMEQVDLLNVKDYTFNTSSSITDIHLIAKIKANDIKLGSLFKIKNGMKVRKQFVADVQVNKSYKPFLLGSSVKPYTIDYKGKWVCYDKSLETKFSNQAFRDEIIFTESPKILVRQVMGKNRIFSTIDNASYYVDQSVYILLPKSSKVDIKYFLALINSKVLYYFFSKTSSDRKITFPKIKGVQLADFPMPKLKSHAEIVKLVDQLLKLNEELQNTKLEEKQGFLKDRIQACENKIDKLVYELYGLTEEEIEMVEEIK